MNSQAALHGLYWALVSIGSRSAAVWNRSLGSTTFPAVERSSSSRAGMLRRQVILSLRTHLTRDRNVTFCPRGTRQRPMLMLDGAGRRLSPLRADATENRLLIHFLYPRY